MHERTVYREGFILGYTHTACIGETHQEAKMTRMLVCHMGVISRDRHTSCAIPVHVQKK